MSRGDESDQAHENPGADDGGPGAPEPAESPVGDGIDEPRGARPESSGTAPAQAGGRAVAAPGTAPPEPDSRRRRSRALRWAAIASAAILLGGAGAFYGLYRDLRGDITQEHVLDQLGEDRPAKLNKSLNILLLGSDTRQGENSRYGGAADMPGARSDTAILLHLSPNRDRAVAVSFPRDSMVQIPACKQRKEPTVPARFGMLNSAFAFAGPTCTWKTLESLTGIHIDHYVQIDFTGFKRVVDALDGVEICVPRPVNDPRAELHLDAGRQTLNGDEALGYVRARYSLGNGSDLERIERQQRFMAAVVDKATTTRLLANPGRTYKFLSAAAKSISTDDELTLSTMRRLAGSLKGMSAGKVRFITVPVERYVPDPNRVQWNMTAAKPLFAAIRADDALPAPPSPSPGAVKEQPPKPAEIRIKLIDATGTKGSASPAAQAARMFGRRGFKVDERITAQSPIPVGQIRFGPAGERKAGVIAAVVPAGQLTPDDSIGDDTVVVVVGSGGLRPAPPRISDIGGLSAERDACRQE